MGSRWPGCKCYWIEPTGTGRVILRRFTFQSRPHGQCPAGKSGHDAQRMQDGEHPVVYVTQDDRYIVQQGVPDDLVPSHRSRRWPSRCETCGGLFPKNAQWQASWAEGYRRADNGEVLWARHYMGVEFAGALLDVVWLHGEAGQSFYKVQDRGDGIILGAVTPNGHMWVVDGKATGGGYWSRTGDPRRPETLTVSPSIAVGDQASPTAYHGFLQQGRFTDDLGG